MARIRNCRRYMIDVNGVDPLSLGELGGGGPVLWRVLVLPNVLGQSKLVAVSGICTN